MMKKTLLLVNPVSGRKLIKNLLVDAVNILNKHDFQTEIRITQGKDDAKNYVIENGNLYSHIIVSGGDGTLSECINGLMRLDSPFLPTIGYIPSGSTNDFANSLGLSPNVIQATKDIVEGVPFKIDIGQFNFNYFSYIAAFGAFSDVSYETPQDMKNFWGHTAYLIEGLKRLPTITPVSMEIKYDEGEISDEFIYGMVSNTTSIGGVVDLSKTDVSLSDGLFEMLLVKAPKNPIDYQNIITGLLSQDFSSDIFYYLKTKKATFFSEKQVKYTLDGESGGAHVEAAMVNHKQAINILIPKNR